MNSQKLIDKELSLQAGIRALKQLGATEYVRRRCKALDGSEVTRICRLVGLADMISKLN